MSFFISYSSHDDKDPKKWVVKFHEDLKNRLNTLSGKEIKVMLDRYDLDGNILGKGLEEMIEQTEGLVAVLSPSYLNKQWCSWERKIFLENLNKLYPEEDPEERLFVAVKLPKLNNGVIDLNYNKQLPKVFERLKRYHFFSTDEKGNVQELLPTQKQFKTELNALAHQLINFLEKNSRPAVYLAQTNCSCGERSLLLHELIAHGYNVIPRNDLINKDSQIQHFDRMIQKCILSVHLLSSEKVNEGAPDLEFCQVERAQRNHVPVLVWSSPGRSEEIRSLPALTAVDDFVKGPFQDFSSVVFETLEDLKK
jgi:hypothetical protein